MEDKATQPVVPTPSRWSEHIFLRPGVPWIVLSRAGVLGSDEDARKGS